MNVIYCSGAVANTGSGPTSTAVINVSGLVMAPDSSLVDLGGGTYGFGTAITMNYLISTESVEQQVLATLASGYGYTDGGRVVFFPPLTR